MKKICCFVIIMLILIACHHKINSSSDMPGDKALENTQWKLVALNGISDSISSLSKAPFMHLDSGRVRGFAVCNNYFGAYNKEKNAIHFSGVASTKMFCAQGTEVENALFRVLNDVNSYHVSGNRMELLKDSKVLAGFTAE